MTAHDAALVLQHTVASTTLAGPAALAADVTQAGGISSLDASSILQVSVGVATLPAAALSPARHRLPGAYQRPVRPGLHNCAPGRRHGQLGHGSTLVALPKGHCRHAAILWLETRPVAEGIHDLVFTLAYSGDPIYSVDLVVRYDPARLEVLLAEVPTRPGQLSAINLADRAS